MIVSASRRTDLPAFYPAWLAARFRAGEVLRRSAGPWLRRSAPWRRG